MIWLRYVTLENVGPLLAKGWTITDDLTSTHHGFYAVLMQWVGDGEPS